MSGSEDEADFASADEGEPETQSREPGEKDWDSKHGKERKHSGGKKHKVEVAQPSEADSNEETKTSETVKTATRQKKEKDIKVTPSKNDTAEKAESLSQEVEDKLTVTDKETVIGKGKQGKTEQKKSDTTDSGKDSKGSMTVTDTTGGLTPSERNVKYEHSDGVTPVERTGQEEVMGTINSELDRETIANMIKSPSSQSIQRPPPDHTREQEQVLEGLADSAKLQTGWGWGWGSSLLNVASTSVSTFTKEVGEGIHTVMETVESTLKVPAPEKLAEGWEEELDDNEEEITGTVTHEPHHQPEPTQTEADQSQKEAAESEPPEEKEKSQSEGSGWFSSWGVSNISNIVQKSGKTFVTGGLDVLESIGKKTFDVIKDHDPGLRKTKGLLFERGDKPNLSQMLRDAKEQREAQERQEQECEEARKAHFGSLFDDFQGLAHLEALEMLSNQSEKRVNSLLNALAPETITAVKPQLLKIKENFEIGEEEEDVEEQDFVRLVTELFTSLGLGNTPAKLTKVHDSIKQNISELKEKLETETKPEPKEIHRAAIKSLAELTSKSIEQFQKTGELILIKKAEQTDLVLSSKHLASLTKVLCAEVGIVSTQFSECLNQCLTEENSAVVNPLVTNVYLEATNSSSYIQDGFQLLLPVLQQTALEKTQEPDS